MRDGRWFSETSTGGVRFSLEASKVLLHERTGAQEVALIDNDVFGRVLLLDGVVQLTTRDEFVYHEMLAHAPLLAHGTAEDVLIVGGGDCGLAEEVLKHESVRTLTQVEIDPAVVELARQHLADVNSPVFSDPRFRLVIDDGAAFVEREAGKFDVVLVDSTDPIGPGAVLASRRFYAAVRERLAAGGLLVTQNGVPFLQAAELRRAIQNLASTFRHVACCAITVPSYFGGQMALAWSADDDTALSVPLETLVERFERARIDTRCYTPAVHKAAFVLPRFLADAVSDAVAAGRRG
ncbi:MAG TPA: polyamine aminopropyltransferase [Gammaproteobacteria bacterium]